MSHHDDAPMGTASTSQRDCRECPAAVANRRAFLRDIGLTVLGAIAVGAVTRPAAALAESIVETNALSKRSAERTYAIPARDSIAIDTDDEVIVARWENRVYAFSLRCPHRGTQLEWHADERRVFCPKHKARFRPDGAHDSGRRTRDLDRYELSRQGTSIVVNLDALHRVDQDPEAWGTAVIILS